MVVLGTPNRCKNFWENQKNCKINHGDILSGVSPYLYSIVKPAEIFNIPCFLDISVFYLPLMLDFIETIIASLLGWFHLLAKWPFSLWGHIWCCGSIPLYPCQVCRDLQYPRLPWYFCLLAATDVWFYAYHYSMYIFDPERSTVKQTIFW